MKYKIGLCQFEPTLLNKAKNLQKIQKMIDGVEADLIVFPELATSGYVFNNKEEVISVADDFKKSETTEILIELSKKNNTTLVIGFPEKSRGKLYNSSMLINPDKSTYLYRKIHLFNEEKKWFEPGNLGFTPVKAKNQVIVGQMICFDWIFPEAARTLMLKGSQIIAHPANLVLPWCQQAMLTRSLENRIFSITCNRIGTEINDEKEFYFTGMSQAVSPLGEILFRLEKAEEKVQIIEIETDQANNKEVTAYNNILLDRQVKFYQKG